MRKGTWSLSSDIRFCFPAVLRGVDTDWLTVDEVPRLVIPGWKCHSQAVELAVQKNNQATKRVKSLGTKMHSNKRDTIANILYSHNLSYKNRSDFSKKVQNLKNLV